MKRYLIQKNVNGLQEMEYVNDFNPVIDYELDCGMVVIDLVKGMYICNDLCRWAEIQNKNENETEIEMEEINSVRIAFRLLRHKLSGKLMNAARATGYLKDGEKWGKIVKRDIEEIRTIIRNEDEFIESYKKVKK